MDIDAPGQNPEPTNQEPVVQTVTPEPEPKKKRSPKKFLTVLLALLLIAGTAYGAYWWRGQELKELRSDKDSKISELEQKIQTLEAAEETPVEEQPTEETAATKAENIEAAVESGNYAALETYMADTVRVILAASEGVGDRTPAQAVSDMKYLDTGTDPWNFALPAATLSEWGTGDYAQYFPVGAVVGQAANGYVVSFTYDAAGDINGIFMAASGELL